MTVPLTDAELAERAGEAAMAWTSWSLHNIEAGAVPESDPVGAWVGAEIPPEQEAEFMELLILRLVHIVGVLLSFGAGVSGLTMTDLLGADRARLGRQPPRSHVRRSVRRARLPRCPAVMGGRSSGASRYALLWGGSSYGQSASLRRAREPDIRRRLSGA